MANIAVFGGAGEVGQYVVEALNYLGHQLTIVGRKARPEIMNYQVADLFDVQQVESICRSHDLVINAAGPAYLVRDHIATVAIEMKTPYVDVCGESDVFDALYAKHHDCQSACVMGAGFVPGFSSLLAYLVQKKMQRVDRYELYVGGIEAFTMTSAQDFLASLTSDEAHSGCGVTDGCITRVALKEGITPMAGSPVFSALPYLSAEHQRVAKSLSFDHYLSYNLIADKQLLLVGQGDEVARSIILVETSENSTAKYGCQQYCIVKAKGWLADQPVCLDLHCRFDNGYRMTGWVAAATSHQIVQKMAGRSPNMGLCWLSEAVDIELLLAQLSEAGLFHTWQLSLIEDEEMVFEEGTL